jgi:hypothetical protein
VFCRHEWEMTGANAMERYRLDEEGRKHTYHVYTDLALLCTKCRKVRTQRLEGGFKLEEGKLVSV